MCSEDVTGLSWCDRNPVTLTFYSSYKSKVLLLTTPTAKGHCPLGISFLMGSKGAVKGLDAMTVALAKWSIDEYHRMIEAGVLEGRQVELLNGDIVEMVPEGIPHVHLSSKGADYLRELL